MPPKELISVAPADRQREHNGNSYIMSHNSDISEKAERGMDMFGLSLFLFWLFSAFLSGAIAHNKGYGAGGFFLLGLAFGIFAIPAALSLNPKYGVLYERKLQAGLKECRWCHEAVHPLAIVCRYCGRDLAANTQSRQAAAPSASA